MVFSSISINIEVSELYAFLYTASCFRDSIFKFNGIQYFNLIDFNFKADVLDYRVIKIQ